LIKLDNYAKKTRKRKGLERFKWKVFVDEDKETLEKIDYVEYLLHPTFPNPRRIVSNRESRFALRSSGWGQFTVRARVHFKDGTIEAAQHFLDLSKRWPTSEEVPEVEPIIKRAEEERNALSLIKTLKKADPADRAYIFKSLAGIVLNENPESFLKEEILDPLYGKMSRSLLEWSLSHIESALTALKPARKLPIKDDE